MIQREHENYSIKINESNGNIESLKIKGKELIFTENIISIFKIQLRDENGKILGVESKDFDKTEVTWNKEKCEIKYTNCTKACMDVYVKVVFEEDILWNIEVQNNTNELIEWVQFPQIIVPNDLIAKGGNSRILWGFSEGVEIEDTDLREKYCGPQYCEAQYPSDWVMGIFPGIVQTQFMAYYDGIHGFYVGAHDQEENVKAIDWYTMNNGIKLQFRQFTGLYSGEDYKMNYYMVMRAFEGDWHDAAEIYRNWFDTHKGETFKLLSQNEKLPEWYHDSPIVVTYPVRGRHDTDEMTPNQMYPYIRGMGIIEQLAERLNTRILVLLMHWEGTAPWAPPYVWPPYGGEEALKEYVDALHEKGHLIGVYCSGLGWTLQSNTDKSYVQEDVLSKEKLEQIMCISPENTLPLSINCTPQRISYDMCTASNFTVDTVVKEVASMVSAKLDYIQLLDQNHGGTQYFCYSKNHGHPPVPGIWQVDSMKKLLREAEKFTLSEEKKVVLGCEAAAAEAYIPQLLLNDNRFELNYGFGTPVPLYAYVYHEYINNFMGNQVNVAQLFDLTKIPENFLYRMAYSFVAGDMLTFVLNETGNIQWSWGQKEFIQEPEQKSILELAKILNDCRKTWKQFLHYGRMERPFLIAEFGTINMPMRCGYTFKAPKLLTSCWKSEDGKHAQFIVNYSKEDVCYEINVSEETWLIKNSKKLNDMEKIVPTVEPARLLIKGLSVSVLLF